MYFGKVQDAHAYIYAIWAYQAQLQISVTQLRQCHYQRFEISETEALMSAIAVALTF